MEGAAGFGTPVVLAATLQDLGVDVGSTDDAEPEDSLDDPQEPSP